MSCFAEACALYKRVAVAERRLSKRERVKHFERQQFELVSDFRTEVVGEFERPAARRVELPPEAEVARVRRHVADYGISLEQLAELISETVPYVVLRLQTNPDRTPKLLRELVWSFCVFGGEFEKVLILNPEQPTPPE